MFRLVFSRFVVAPLTLLLAVLAAFASCSDPLGPDYGLDSSRILAVRANPPDLVPGSAVTLDALVFVPSVTDNVAYEWTWCAAVDDNLECAESAAALGAELDASALVDYSLGTGPTARFAYPVVPALLEALCTTTSDAGTGDAGDDGGDAGDGGAVDAGTKLTCNGASVSVTVLLKVTVNGKEMRAAKTITIYPTQPAFTNTNPTIDGLESFDHAVAAPADASDRTDDGIADAAGAPSDAGSGVLRGDNGGAQLLLRVPTTASDSYTPGNGGGGNGGAGGGNAAGGGTNATADGGADDDGAASGEDDDGGGGAGSGSDDGGHEDGSASGDSGSGGGRSGDGGDEDGSASGGGDGGAGDGGGSGGGNGSGDNGGDNGGGATTTDAGTANAAGGNNEQHESLTATWYVQAGRLDSASTMLPAANGNAARDYASLVLNRWAPPGPGVYTVIVVLRDNRNGVGWYVQPVRVR